MPFWARGCCSLRQRPVTVPPAVDRATSRPSPASSRPCSACSSRCSAATTGSLVELQRQDDRRARLRGRAVPPLRDRTAVYENVRSPATYLSRVRDPAKASVPASADPKAAPRWRKVAAAARPSPGTTTGSTGRGSKLAAVVQAAPRRDPPDLPLAVPRSGRREAVRDRRLPRLPADAAGESRTMGRAGWLLAVAIGATPPSSAVALE